jgi:delta-aminolevulinic acid dehydratase/porphobilinogen synthase
MLDSNDFAAGTAILGYAAKYASAFYGRSARRSTCRWSGERRSYQLGCRQPP